jgi:hypothetical protein
VLPLPYHSASLPKHRGEKANAAKGKIKNCKTKAILKKQREKKKSRSVGVAARNYSFLPGTE